MELKDVIEEIPVATEDTKVSKVISLLGRSRTHGVAIVDGRHALVGVIDDRTLRGFREDAELTKARSVAETPMGFELAKHSAEDAIGFFLNSHFRLLPVVKNGVPTGCITRSGVLRLLLGKQVVKDKRAGEFMREAVTVTEGDSIAQAVAKMRDFNTYHVIVVDGKGRATGIVSDFDVACKLVPHYKGKFRKGDVDVVESNVEQESISSIMNPIASPISSETPLETAAKLMADGNFTALAVLDDQIPVGLLSARGVLHCCLVEQPGNVVVLGLRPDEKAMQESILGECNALMGKLNLKLRPQLLTLHVKSSQLGAKRRYAVRGRLFISGRVISASTPDTDVHKNAWNAHLACKEVLEELSRQASDHIHSLKGHKRERIEKEQ